MSLTKEQRDEVFAIIEASILEKHRVAVLAALDTNGPAIVERFFARSGYITHSETIKALDATVANELRQHSDVITEARRWIDANLHAIVQRAVTDIIVQLVGHALAGNASRIADTFLPPVFGAYSNDVAGVIDRVRAGMQSHMTTRGL